MIDWNRRSLIQEVTSVIEENVLKGNIEFESPELKEMLESLNRGDSNEDLIPKILYLAWNIPSGVLPVAAEAVINSLIEEALKKNAE